MPAEERRFHNGRVWSALFASLALVVLLAVLVLIAAGASATVHRGGWRAHRADTGLVWFESDRGRFGFPNANTVAVQRQHQPELRIPLTEVVALRFTYQQLHSREALEAVGVRMWPRQHWPRQLDRYDVAVVTAAGDVPVFLAGQIFMLTPVGGSLVSRVVEWLHARGFVPDVEAHARAVVDELQEEFARRGHPVRLA